MVVISVCLFIGGVHCSAWNFSFPTRTEQFLWRANSLTVATIVPFFWLVSFVYWSLYRMFMETTERRLKIERVTRITYWYGTCPELEYSQRSSFVWRWILRACAYVYVIARLGLIVLIFMGLRSLPEGCYRPVAWLVLIPSVL